VISLRFEGVATHCTVYVNGHLLHRHFTGYTPFTIDITDVVEFGEEPNVIAVRVDATYPEGWWYEGAGIYRHVWLVKTPPLRFAEDGLFVCPRRVDAERWNIVVRATVENRSDRDIDANMLVEISELPAIVAGSDRVRVSARSSVEVERSISMKSPRLWSPDEPSLYTLRATLRTSDGSDGNHGDEDRINASFGCREARFDADRGFFLNGQPLKLLGACCHQDHAGVGVAVPDSLWEFRVRRLKEFGFNAIRCAHHPPARELLDACDRLGMLVMDENRNFGSSPEHLRQLSAMVRRDRNHPCVILWCLCNEEALQGEPVSGRIARTMSAEVRRLDPSRPITAAISGGLLNDETLADVVDVVGVNYQVAQYDALHAKRPTKPIVASETHCVFGTRGVDRTDASAQVFADDDSEHAFWSCSARETWRAVSSREWIAGLFVWTGFDYRGEPAPHEWPSVSSHWGLLDLCGFEKNVAQLHRAWFTREPFVFIGGHWNPRDAGDERRRVAVYSNCDEVELQLNGVSLGRKPIDAIEMAYWDLDFARGELSAVGFVSAARAAETLLQTTGPTVALGLEVHPSMGRSFLFAGVDDALPVTVFGLDASGRRVPDATDEVELFVSGAGRLLGTGNGDPNSHEPSTGNRRRLFAGLMQAIVQAGDVSGVVVIEARASGLTPARLELAVQPCTSRLRVPTVPPVWFINDFRMSPLLRERPNAAADIPEADVNSWPTVRAGGAQAVVVGSGFVLLRGAFTLPRLLQTQGALLRLHEVSGAAEVLLDGQLVARRESLSPGPIEVPVPASSDKRQLTVLLRSDGQRCGLIGRVELLARS
jgi:beta-galactosidase